MKVRKRVLRIAVECLSDDCFYSIVQGLLAELERENYEGQLIADDGDTVTWKRTIEEPKEI